MNNNNNNNNNTHISNTNPRQSPDLKSSVPTTQSLQQGNDTPPSSYHVSASKLTTAKATAARRNALREFYKLPQQELNSQVDNDGESGLNSSDNGSEAQLGSDSGQKVYDEGVGGVLDKMQDEWQRKQKVNNKDYKDDNSPANDEANITEDTSRLPDKYPAVNAFVRNLIEQHDLKTLLKYENELVGEVKTLDSEQKALVYNNYSKLTAASTTLGNISSEVGSGKDQGDESKESEEVQVFGEPAFNKPAQKKIDILLAPEKKQRIEKAISGVIGTLGDSATGVETETAETKTETTKEVQTDIDADLTKTAKWLFSVPVQLTRLKQAIISSNNSNTRSYKPPLNSRNGVTSSITSLQDTLKAANAASNNNNPNANLNDSSLKQQFDFVQSKATKVLDFLIQHSSPNSSDKRFCFDVSEMQELKQDILKITL